MNDRELLEYAAKAAGIEHYGEYNASGGLKTTGGWWNPIDGDSAAFQLAVKLGLNIIGNAVATVSVRAGNDHDVSEVFIQLQRTDHPYAATRRAIVRAAAEIGRSQS
jgi:hypothetical protein